MPDLGTKHECTSCSTKFYDLGKPEPICPKCGLNLITEEEEEPAPAPEKTARKKPAKASGKGSGKGSDAGKSGADKPKK